MVCVRVACKEVVNGKLENTAIVVIQACHAIHYELTVETLDPILTVPQALKHFSYFNISTDWLLVFEPTFGVAIGRLKATLQFLVLGFSQEYLADEVIIHIGAFRDWPVLTRIKSRLFVVTLEISSACGEIYVIPTKTLKENMEKLIKAVGTLEENLRKLFDYRGYSL